jgi:hypothetical protein
MELDHEQFIKALQGPKVEADLQEFLDDHNLKVSVADVLHIAQMVCKVSDAVCPLIEGM